MKIILVSENLGCQPLLKIEKKGQKKTLKNILGVQGELLLNVVEVF